ncbi:MAG: glycosyltransferase [Patescibacteria group bacterium]
MSKVPKVSIIIPLYVDTPRFYRDLKKIIKLDYPSYEIIIVTDNVLSGKKIDIDRINAKVILTGKNITGPAEKRDIAIQQAKGEICAFIDDDAYPDVNWLKHAIVHFQHPQIVAVGGPGITPKEDNYWEQLTGLVYGSFFCGGHAQHRFIKKDAMFVVDYPAYNLIVRKDVLMKVGGYGTHFYGGEDTFLCLKLIKGGHRILYDPEVVVYHHRRALFVPYLKQIANIGMHRGYFAKVFPETSFQINYFIPSILTVGFFAGIVLSFFNRYIAHTYLILLLFFISVSSFSVIRKTDFKKSFIVAIGIILTHITYGIFFIKGLLTKELLR